MRPGVCTAPEPAPERETVLRKDASSRFDYGLNPNYVEQIRQAEASSKDVKQRRQTDGFARRCCLTFLLDVFYLTPFGSSPHHHIAGRLRCRGQTSFNVAAS